jgi:hypothetical protein
MAIVVDDFVRAQLSSEPDHLCIPPVPTLASGATLSVDICSYGQLPAGALARSDFNYGLPEP